LPKFSIPLKDKFIHAFFYFIFIVLSYKSLHTKYRNSKSAAFIVLLSLIIGIFIEVLQGQITTSRNFDVYDITANIFGSFIGILLIYIKKYITQKRVV